MLANSARIPSVPAAISRYCGTTQRRTASDAHAVIGTSDAMGGPQCQSMIPDSNGPRRSQSTSARIMVGWLTAETDSIRADGASQIMPRGNLASSPRSSSSLSSSSSPSSWRSRNGGARRRYKIMGAHGLGLRAPQPIQGVVQRVVFSPPTECQCGNRLLRVPSCQACGQPTFGSIRCPHCRVRVPDFRRV